MSRQDYILTYTKQYLNPLQPSKQYIQIEDIAHALSFLCRANGHIKHFYSVAQHSIQCSLEARQRGYSQRIQLACLLHDASEAYLSDITRPVKKHLTEYISFEKKLQDTIWDTFFPEPLTLEEQAKVSEVDDHVLYFEFHALADEFLPIENAYLHYPWDYAYQDFNTVTNDFLFLFHTLYQSIT